MPIRMLFMSVLVLFAASGARADELDPVSLLTSFERGGKLMWAILAASMIGCAFAAERLLVIRRRKQIPAKLMVDMREAMVGGGLAAGLNVVDGDKSAMGRVMYALLSRSGATRRELENAIEDEGSRILYDLRANLRPIGVIASIAPLLGLLGTVFGLIAAFRTAAELGMDDPANFAEGIYVALYTTAFGLVVAIPMSIIYHLLRNKADSIMREVEERALAFISAASLRAGGARQAVSPQMHYDDPEDVEERIAAAADSDETSLDEEE